MYARLLSLIVLTTVGALLLLTLRQQRTEVTHEIAGIIDEIHQQRSAIWQQQVSIAKTLAPQELRRAIARAQLVLEPVISRPQQHHERQSLAAVNGEPVRNQRVWPAKP